MIGMIAFWFFVGIVFSAVVFFAYDSRTRRKI